MKKIISAVLLIIIVLALFNIRQLLYIPVIGNISGAENEKITIGNDVYEKTSDSPVSRSDKGKYLGTVTNSIIKMRVYEMPEDDYIYAMWEWEGAIYKCVK
ncbi:MAG: hypothetical protein IJM96_09865 [Clostridia bacterium]|nr:hypothetical protein [Clostridia bacterium]